MAVKSIALGAVVAADFTGGTTYVPIGLLTGFSPPARPGTEADGKTLAEDLDVPLPAIEGPAQFDFSQFYEPGDVAQANIDAAFDNRRLPLGASGGVVAISVRYPHNGIEVGDTMPTEDFHVNVLNIGPEEVTEPNSTFKRAVQCRRITAITPGTFLIV